MLLIVFILMAWFIEMPLWLSITLTAVACYEIIWKLVRFGVRLSKEIEKK